MKPMFATILLIVSFSGLFASERAIDVKTLKIFKCFHNQPDLCSYQQASENQPNGLEVYLDYNQQRYPPYLLSPIANEVTALEVTNLDRPQLLLSFDELTHLKALKFSNSYISDLTFFNVTSNLEKLDVENTKVSIMGLGGAGIHNKLKYLRLSKTRTTFNEGINFDYFNFYNIETLILEDLKINSFEMPMGDNDSLKTVVLRNIVGEMIPPNFILALPRALSLLDVSGSSIEDFKILNYFNNPALKLNLSRTNLKDSDLPFLRRLEVDEIDVSYTAITYPFLFKANHIIADGL